ncbi:hypothetical protein ENUP19_0265G0056 [Entamoeba nuttalli]|uniref:SP-RING zinc finger domain containing protein n=2 Tax=Entamoeba nuttalli TaxID=412467 RepID=K2GD26_ENTNP|nr:SP-RING zinc finger domain containing protein [Entamoeba nuttalli P19]EKE40466.1 SP-RING zinc finger domain containing protein [Entamoeba nuttalli P19]|eukprot:XP_008857201.1 SP-RING zinc finger domain containing protein [Entamoeba nuttalli P19]
MELALPKEYFETISPLIIQKRVIAYNRFNRAADVSVSSLSFEFKNGGGIFHKRDPSSFKFKLLEEPGGKRRVQLRLFDLTTKENLPPYSLAKITINKSSFELSKYFARPKLIEKVNNFKIFNCIDVTDLLKEGKNIISVVSKSIIENGIISLVDIENLGINECVQSIVSKCGRSTELQSVDLEEMDEEMDVEEEQQTISLKCPISYQRIVIPARGLNCSHLACFDLENYIRNSTTKQCFNCPICYKPLPTKEVVIDNKILSLLRQSSDDVSMISINSDGMITQIHDTTTDDSLEKQTDLEEQKYLKKQVTLSLPKISKSLFVFPFQTTTTIPHLSKEQATKPKITQLKRTFAPNTLTQVIGNSELGNIDKMTKGLAPTKKLQLNHMPQIQSLFKGKGESKDDPIEL